MLKLRQRIIAVVLAVMLMMGMVPSAAFAQTDTQTAIPEQTSDAPTASSDETGGERAGEVLSEPEASPPESPSDGGTINPGSGSTEAAAVTAVSALSSEESAASIKVYIDVEGYNLGQGYYVTPVELTLPAGSTAQDAVRALFDTPDLKDQGISATGIESNYVSSIKNIDKYDPKMGQGILQIPRYITEKSYAQLTTDSAKQAGNSSSPALSEFSYSAQSGWMYTVNHALADSGMKSFKLKDGDVIRWQFTVAGYGADLGLASEGYGEDSYYTHVDKSALIRALFAPGAPTSGSPKMQAALDVIIDPTATTIEVNAALSGLLVTTPPVDGWMTIDAPNGSLLARIQEKLVSDFGQSATAYDYSVVKKLRITGAVTNADFTGVLGKTTINSTTGGYTAKSELFDLQELDLAGITGIAVFPTNALRYLRNLTTIRLPEGITTGSTMFLGTDKLTTVVFGSAAFTPGVADLTGYKQTAFANDSFNGSGIKKVIYPANIAVPNNMFYVATLLEEVDFLGNVPSVGDGAFAHINDQAYTTDTERARRGFPYGTFNANQPVLTLYFRGETATPVASFNTKAFNNFGPYTGGITKPVAYVSSLTSGGYEQTSFTSCFSKVLQIAPPAPAVGKEALETLIAANEGLVLENYTAVSWTGFASALTAAKNILANDAATQAETDNALQALLSAAEALTKPSYNLQIDATDYLNNLSLSTSYKEMGLGDSYQLQARRLPEIIDNPINNTVTLPDFHYEVVKGNSVSVSQTGVITPLTLGCSVIHVTYDAKVANTTPYGKISPINTGVVIVNVTSGAAGPKIETNIEHRPYDTIYTTGDFGSLSFTAMAGDGAAVTVKADDAVLNPSNGVYTATTKLGSTIIEIAASKDGATSRAFYVIKTKPVKINVANKNRPGESLVVGDTARISFEGLVMPVYKLATIYNPQFPPSGTVVQYSNDAFGLVSSRNDKQYELGLGNGIELTLTQAGEFTFSGGNIYEKWWGEPLYSDLDFKDRPPNMDAKTLEGHFSTLPDFSFTVLAEENAEPPVQVDKTALDDAIATAEALAETDYTPLSWAGFSIALSVARIIAASDSALQDAVDEAVENLATAQDALVLNITYIKVSKGATVGVYKKESAFMHYVPFTSYTLARVEDKSDADYDVYKVTLPTGSAHIEAYIPGETVKSVKLINYTAATANKGETITLNLTPLAQWVPAQGYYAADMYTNLNDSGALNLASGESFALDTFRVWQVVDNTTNNYFVEPNFNFELIGNNVSIERIGSPGREQLKITALKAGTSVIKITYDPMERTLANGSVEKFNGSTPGNTGLVVINVDGGGVIDSGITARNDFDTYYFDKTVGFANFSFTPDAGTSVRVHDPLNIAAWGSGWTSYSAAVDGSFTVKLKEGRNIIELTNAGATRYRVVKAAGVSVTVENSTHPGEPFIAGDTARVSVTGMQVPIQKMAGVYNPGTTLATRPYMRYTNGSIDIKSNSSGQYSTLTDVFTVTYLLEDTSKNVLTGQLYCGASLGSGLTIGSHRFISADGTGKVLGGGQTAPESGHYTGNDCKSCHTNISGGQAATGDALFFGALPEIVLPLTDDEPIEPPTAPTEITVLMSYFESTANGFGLARREFTVSSDLAEKYGYQDNFAAQKVSALDAIVAAHLAVYGDNAEAINNALAVNGTNGYLTKAMGKSGGSFFYFINGVPPEVGVTDFKLSEGDLLELFAYQDATYYTDKYAWFEHDGKKVDTLNIKAGQEFSLSVQGLMALWYMYGDVGDYIEPIEDAAVATLLLENGTAAFNEPLGTTGKNGEVTLKFDAAGTYILSAFDAAEDTPLMAPWLVVTVEDAEPTDPGDPGNPVALPSKAAVASLLGKVAAYQQDVASGAGYESEWVILGLARGGYLSDDLRNEYLVRLEKCLKDNGGVLDKATDYERVILTLAALGVDARDFAGYDLVAKISDLSNVKRQGINGAIFALLALDSGNYQIASGATATREALVAEILSREIAGGGWSLVGAADADITGMVLQALAPYYNNSNAALDAAVERALSKLSSMQDSSSAGFGSGIGGSFNLATESCVQVLVALNALGIPVNDTRFVKNGKTVYDALSEFYLDTAAGKGAFTHVKGGGVNGMATEQGMYGLVSLLRALNGKSGLYDMSDVRLGGGGGAITPQPGDKSALLVAISFAALLKQADYTAQSWAAFQVALASARSAAADASASQTKINVEVKDLQAAINALVRATDGTPQLTVNKALLNAAILQARGLNSASYTEASWAKVATALKTAEDVLVLNTATQTDVDNARSALLSAINALVLHTTSPSSNSSSTGSSSTAGFMSVPRAASPTTAPASTTPNKSVLNTAIDSTKALTEKDYTPESWEKLKDALAQAERVVADADATQTDIDAAKNSVLSAISGLKGVDSKASIGTGSTTGSNSTISDADTPLASNTANSLDGGMDVRLILGIAALAIALCLAALVAAGFIRHTIRRRKEGEEMALR